MIFVTDLEGVLIPEIWVEIADKTGIPELRLTTHEVEDFETLMAARIKALAAHGLKLADVARIAQDVMPFAGSIEFLSWLRRKGPILVVSDTFTELADEIIMRLGGYPLFANRFETDGGGRIVGYKLRIRGQKDRMIVSLKDIGYHLVAIGDGFNDLSMLKIAHHPILFNPSPQLSAKLPGQPAVRDYVELKKHIEQILRANKNDMA
ncbi:bifunctional phosphoserine phosphatase/homoserine phosphotransferase ThrH [bacterium]|nr:bifunctional phosphoserine phosphatase/homoserine phosphotransferase ThrH [bacterium]